MVDPYPSSSDGSGGGKRRSSSPPLPFGSPTKRSKAEVTAKGDAEAEKPEEEAPVAAEAKEGTSSRSAVAAGKRPAHLTLQNTPPPAATGLQAVEPQQPGPWARLISQSNQISHVLMFGTEFSIGGSETCNIFLKDHDASRVLCKLWPLEQPGECQLAVVGKKGLVELNGAKISKGGISFLEGGDEVAFCKHAFIFQPYNSVPISASPTLPPSHSQIFKDGLKQGLLGPDAIQFTLEDFPYYLSPNTKSVLLSASFLHMEKKFIHMEKKLTESLSGISSLNQRILLSGPSGSEIYQETLIKALARNFGARLLIVDSLLLPVNELRPDSSVDQEVKTLGIDELIEIMWEESISSPLIVLVKDVAKALTGRTESHASLGKELPPGVLIIGSHTEKDSPKDKSHPARVTRLSFAGFNSARQALADMTSGSSGSKLQAGNNDATNLMKHLNNLFPNKISIELPKDKAQLLELKKQLRVDAESLRAEANALIIRKYLTDRGMGCDNIEELPIKDHLLTHDEVDKAVGRSLSYHLEHNKPDMPKDDKLVLSTESLRHGLSGVKNMDIGSSKKALKDLVENEFERNLLSDIIEPNNIGVTFDDIGALENVKETLEELIVVPLKRPELFRKGQLLKPVKGILFFGPPGTGKTMLAKAVATESGAKFINIAMSSITSKWLGEGEKYVKAVFSLASKASPSIIFIDEVDSMLASRESSEEHETMRKMKNEFMVHWDGLRTKDKERVLVLAATNRPFDLDEAVIRRFPRRFMVNLPDASSREKILKLILSKEELAEDVDLVTLASMTDGYSGSDLKNLCIAAAHRPIRELRDREEQEKGLAKDEGRPEPALLGSKDIRLLSMDDLKIALDQGCASLSSGSKNMSQLTEWNEMYGQGGSGKRKKNLSYFM
uniref:Uncharacterized protein n=3 Tax=Avena sativa TaxID=4498 RepID=A0ACD5Y683_AVESA